MTLELYIFSPYIMLFLGLILQSILMVSYINCPQNYTSDIKWKSHIHNFFMHFGFSLFFIFSILFLHTGILWLFGQWVYADWRYQLPAVIIIIILGVQYFIGTMFINPRISDLIYSVISFIIVFYLLNFYIPSGNLRTTVISSIYILIVLLLSSIPIWILNVYFERKPNWSKRNKYLWNWVPKFQKIFNRKVNFIIWIITIIETWLKLFGSSILIW